MGNKIIVITGATGTGKTTVSDYLKTYYHVPQVITHTTRPARKGEVDGKDYYFETDRSFFDNHYLENVVYSGYHYGSSYEGLERGWQRCRLVSIVLDTKGAITYQQKLGDQVVILYLTVSDQDGLINRLKKRGDTNEMVRQRIASEEYQRDLKLPEALRAKAHVILNDDWQLTRNQIDNLMHKLTESVANQ
ncbi:guanylate kinase [Pediococcus cellicola]|nr:guanylate kinase [Pediococcus cellicola]GEL14924.1 guanylate kinase [Pediococcus cellicola]